MESIGLLCVITTHFRVIQITMFKVSSVLVIYIITQADNFDLLLTLAVHKYTVCSKHLIMTLNIPKAPRHQIKAERRDQSSFQSVFACVGMNSCQLRLTNIYIHYKSEA